MPTDMAVSMRTPIPPGQRYTWVRVGVRVRATVRARVRVQDMTQVKKRWPESSYFLPSREEQPASGVSV